MPNHTLVRYEAADGIATITLDDGKRNALSPAVFRQLYAAIDQAEKDKATIILTGRDGVFSAGFDLKVMRGGKPDALVMLRSGYALTAKLMAYPHPVIVACNGHCFAMGVFMMLSADYIIGTQGDFRISANEVALGLTMPRVAATTLQQRLTPAAFQRAVTLSEEFTPEEALQAGFFDMLVDSPELARVAREKAQQFSQLDATAHAASKQRIRADAIKSIRRQLPLDLVEAVKLGLRSVKSRNKAA